MLVKVLSVDLDDNYLQKYLTVGNIYEVVNDKDIEKVLPSVYTLKLPTVDDSKNPRITFEPIINKNQCEVIS